MPRLDETDPLVKQEFAFLIKRDSPVDVCKDCYQLFFQSVYPVDHPPYESDNIYNCPVCTKKLTEDDNDPA